MNAKEYETNRKLGNSNSENNDHDTLKKRIMKRLKATDLSMNQRLNLLKIIIDK